MGDNIKIHTGFARNRVAQIARSREKIKKEVERSISADESKLAYEEK